jgi:hypothetical protein
LFEVPLVRNDREASRQQEIAGVTGFDPDDVTDDP